MPKQCKVWGCTHNNMKHRNFSYYEFPKDPERLQMWVTALNRLNRDGSPWWPAIPKNHHVCSEHFVTGKPSSDNAHVDFVPTLLPNRPRQTASKGKENVDRHSRALRRTMQKLIPPRDVSNGPKASLQGDISNGEDRTCWISEDFTATERQAETPLSAVEVVLGNCEPEVEPTIATPAAVADRQDTHHDHAYTQIHREQGDISMESLSMEISNLRTERDHLKDKVQILKEQQMLAQLQWEIVFSRDQTCRYLTGISSPVLSHLYQFCMDGLKDRQLGTLVHPKDQLLTTLVRLRHNIPFEYLALQRGVSSSTVSDMFWRWVEIIFQKMNFLVQWPDRDAVIATLPAVFKKEFPRLTGIGDCFEIFVERPSKLEARAQLWSNYKHHSTVKIFVVCSPVGSVTYLSTVWGGRASDVEIVRSSDFISLKYHTRGDQILVDRGFTLEEDFANIGVELIMPAFTKGKKQLSAADVDRSRRISCVRIHIERVIGLMRNRYTILKGTLKLSDIKSSVDESDDLTLARIDKIVRVCGILTNLGDGIINN